MEITPSLLAILEAEAKRAEQDGITLCIVGAVVVWNGAVLLLTRAADDDYLPGHLEFPGGGRDPGESLLDALAREIREETGLAIKRVRQFVGSVDYRNSEGKARRRFTFVIEPETDAVVLDPVEHSAFIWLPCSEKDALEPFPMSDFMRGTVRDLMAQIAS